MSIASTNELMASLTSSFLILLSRLRCCLAALPSLIRMRASRSCIFRAAESPLDLKGFTTSSGTYGVGTLHVSARMGSRE